MKIKHVVPVVAALTLALAVPALAGGAQCSGTKSAAVANAEGCCANKASTAVWAGAWLERSQSGSVRVADVAKNSPAARSGLKRGDIVVAVNGNKVGANGECSFSHEECALGSSVAYTVQRGRSTKVMKLKLEQMPATATERFADREASFDPMLATLVLTSN